VTVYSDNAAGRLHGLITSFRGNASAQTVPQAWGAVLGIGDANSPVLLRRLFYVFRLPDEIEREIALVDDQEYDSDLALRWRATIPQRLGPSLFAGQRSDQISAALDDASLSSLEYCSVVLHRYRPQRVFSTDELARIGNLVSELGDEVLADTGMDQSLRDFLFSHVVAMSEALDGLALRGPSALEDAFDRMVGATERRMDLTVRMEDNKSAWTKFQNLIIGVAAVLQITTSAFVLPGQVRQELEGPPPPQAPVVKIIEVPPHEPGLIVVPKVQQGSDEAAQSQGARQG
jgi:hypothetical protein